MSDSKGNLKSSMAGANPPYHILRELGVRRAVSAMRWDYPDKEIEMSLAGFVAIVFFILICIMCNGIKKITLKIMDYFDWLHDLRRKRIIEEFNKKKEEDDKRYHHMEVVSFTCGRCDVCGKEIISTTEDDSPHFQKIKFAVENGTEQAKIVCRECLNRFLGSTYFDNRNGGRVETSEQAERFGSIFKRR